MATTKNVHGMLALFETAPAIYEAAKTVKAAGYKKWDVIAPFPVHGLDDAMGIQRSKVPVFTFIGGFIGFWTGMFMAWFMGSFDYPLIVGGKPFFHPVFPFPIAYELTILLAAFGTLGGMFILNRLPMHHHPVMNYEEFRRLTDDRFAVIIESSDELYDEEATRNFLEELQPLEISVVKEEAEVLA